MFFKWHRNQFLLFLLPALAACDDRSDIRDFLPTRSYYAAYPAMEPTIPQNAILWATKITASEAKRGDILIVRSERGEDYLKRLIALPGDTVGMIDGAIILNGEPIEQILMGDYNYQVEEDGGRPPQDRTATRYREQLPDTRVTYFVLDEGLTALDDYPEVELGAGQYFFLGDNRDNSADSRAQPINSGLGIVAGDQIIRRIDLSSIEP